MSERYIASLAMTNGVIKSTFGRHIRTNQLEHSPYVWYRDLYPMSRQHYRNYVRATLTHKFRHPEDLVPTFANQAFIRHIASKKGFEEKFDSFYSSKYVHDTEEESLHGETRNIKRNRTILKYGFHIVEDHLREKTMRFGQIFDDATRNINLYSDIVKDPSFLFYNLNDDYHEPKVSEELHEFMEFMYPDKLLF